jgi:hypothetical protein
MKQAKETPVWKRVEKHRAKLRRQGKVPILVNVDKDDKNELKRIGENVEKPMDEVAADIIEHKVGYKTEAVRFLSEIFENKCSNCGHKLALDPPDESKRYPGMEPKKQVSPDEAIRLFEEEQRQKTQKTQLPEPPLPGEVKRRSQYKTPREEWTDAEIEKERAYQSDYKYDKRLDRIRGLENSARERQLLSRGQILRAKSSPEGKAEVARHNARLAQLDGYKLNKPSWLTGTNDPLILAKFEGTLERKIEEENLRHNAEIEKIRKKVLSRAGIPV